MSKLIVAVALGAFIASGAVFSSAPIAEAQECGTYIILGCFKSRSGAEAKRRQLSAPMVIRTNDFPNFRPGWYCVADGPYNSGWQEELNWYQTRTDGQRVSDAYAKAAC